MYKVDPYRKFAKRDKNENRLLTRKQKKKIMSEYNEFYIRISRNAAIAYEYKDRTQVHHIKNRIRAIQCIANAELFIPYHVKDGLYSYYMVKATPKNIQIIE